MNTTINIILLIILVLFLGQYVTSLYVLFFKDFFSMIKETKQKISDEQAKALFDNAGVIIKDVYPSGNAHHRKTLELVLIERVALDEKTLTKMVIYYHNGITWARPLNEFLKRFKEGEP